MLMILPAFGFAQTIATQVTLTGTGTDSDGTIVSYKWKQVSGPATPTIVSPNSAVTVVKDYSVPGIYKYELTVTDNQGAEGKDTTTVTVLPANNRPQAKGSASPNVIQLPMNSTSLRIVNVPNEIVAIRE